jgi:ubiquinone/menaquinone biosynthesis C-methylase UbiE
MTEEILRYYQQAAEEQRLSRGSGLLEYARIQEIVTRYLPPPPAHILDVGGGPGAHASWLVERGYAVYLLDPVERHLEQAARLPLAGVALGDARELPCENASADAVLLLGPLYHLTQREDRLAALREAKRALKPGGLLFALAISRWASLLHGLLDGYLDDPLFQPLLDRDLAQGVHENPTGHPRYFTTSVLHRPEELREEIASAGFAEIEVLAVEGPGWLARDLEERWKEPERRSQVLDLMRRVEKEPALFGCSLHLMGIGRAPDDSSEDSIESS